jgi:hypothetical protein
MEAGSKISNHDFDRLLVAGKFFNFPFTRRSSNKNSNQSFAGCRQIFEFFLLLGRGLENF